MNDLIVVKKKWDFLVVPEHLNDYFIKELLKSYNDFAHHKDSNGLTDVPILEDVVNDISYYRVIESYWHSFNDNVPFYESYYYDKCLKNLAEEDRAEEENYVFGVYQNDIFTDAKLVADTFHLSYQNSWSDRCPDTNSYPNVEVW